MKPILTPSENLLSAAQVLSACLTPGNSQGKRYNRQLHARVVKAAKSLHILPPNFRAAFVGLVLDANGNQHVFFFPEEITTTLDSLSAVTELAERTIAEANTEIRKRNKSAPPGTPLGPTIPEQHTERQPIPKKPF